MSRKERVEEEYQLLMEIYGVDSNCWSMMHESFSSSSFCPKNRKSFISEYLAWEDFVERAHKYGVTYYCGIDDFLAAYKDTVYSCLQNLD